MLKAINTKSSWLSSQRCMPLTAQWHTSGTETERASAAIGKAAAILEAQQTIAAAERKPGKAFQQQVEQDKRGTTPLLRGKTRPGRTTFLKHH